MATTIDLGKIRLQWKGDYSNATSYELLDVVKFKGDSYVFISTIAAANKTPDTTSEWDLMVSGGDQWSTGTSVPTGGNPGDMYLKTDDEKVYTNTAGSWGVVGDMGGSRWTSGTSAPSGGEDGDFYLKTDDEKVYERVSGSWAVKLDIGGGVWTSGTSVPTGGEAGDFYIKTDDEKIYENVAGTWTVKLDIGGGVWTSSTSNGSGGESGDWHINTTTKDIQENVSGTWTTRVNLSVSGTNLSDLANVPALDSGKFLTNDGTTASWATVDVTGASVGGDVTGTVGNIQLGSNSVGAAEIAANAVGQGELADGAVDTNAIANSAVTDAKIAGMSSSKLSGNLPAIDGSALTGVGVGFDSGVKMVFAQAAAPTGWTQDTSSNDAALRVVSGSGGGTGGSAGFSAPSHSLSGGSTTLSTAQMPSHDHTAIYTTRSGYQGAAYLIPYQQWFYHTNTFSKSGNIGVSGGNSSHNHSLSGSITAPKYKDVIVATKD